MRNTAQAMSQAFRVGACLAIVSAFSFTAGRGHAGEPGPLQVTVKAEAARQGELPPWAAFKQKAVVFDVTLRVVNKSDATKEFWVWSCCWWENWQMEGKGVGWATGPCTRNSPYLVSLKPGQAHERKVVMYVKSGWSADEVSFRVDFTPSTRRGGKFGSPTYRGEEVIVRVPHKVDE